MSYLMLGIYVLIGFMCIWIMIALGIYKIIVRLYGAICAVLWGRRTITSRMLWNAAQSKWHGRNKRQKGGK